MIKHWLTQIAQIKRLTAGPNNTETYQVFSNIACMIQEFDGNRHLTTNMGLYRPHRMYCQLSTNIKDDDYVIQGTRTFSVKGVIRREQGHGVKHLEVLLELAS